MFKLLARLLFLTMFMSIPAACAQDNSTESGANLTWPRKHELKDATLLIYQPQIETWDGNQLAAQAAVSITPKAATSPEYGVIWISARTDVDKVARIVTLENITINKVSVPQDRVNEPQYLTQINQAVPDTATDVPLDHLEANLEITQAGRKTAAMDVKNDVPRIIFDTRPSILILIDGDPVLRATAQAHVMRVVNTRQLILLDQTSKKYYLFLMDCWVSGDSPLGPWVIVPHAPDGFDALKDSLAKAGAVDLLVPGNPDGAPLGLPVIYTSDKPAELIQSRGEPEYAPIFGTNLLDMKNSENAVFEMLGTCDFYVLVSGRWFKSGSLNGPWKFVPGNALPADFAEIPPDSAKANVLVSVPGTPQANEAVIANSIPQTATVNISQANLTVSYDGTPKFEDIDNDKGLKYAVNAVSPVVFVEATKTYYCVNNGIWFYSASPLGTWAVATVVPPIIYTIPVSSPIHYVTYVRIYGYTNEVVYVGYTPGYMGTCISPDGVVVYGTGYYYPAYVGQVWVGYPPTYGYGAGFACGAATGFAFGFAAGAIIGDCWSRPYWGPCHGFASVDLNSHSVYANWHGGVTSVSRHYDYDPWTGRSNYKAAAASFNPYTGRSSVGGYSNYLDRSNGNFDVRAGGATYNPNTGVISGHSAQAAGNIYNGSGVAERSGFKYNTNTGNGVGYHDGDVYAGHDGNVYRHTNDGWQQRTAGGWQSADRSGNQSFSQQQNLDSQRSSRDLGEQRFQNAGGSSRFHSHGGGLKGRH